MKNKFLSRGFLLTILLIGGVFSVQADVTIDNFEGYQNTTALRVAWSGLNKGTFDSFERYLETDSGNKLMRIDFSYSTPATMWGFTNLHLNPGQDWRRETGIKVWLKGNVNGGAFRSEVEPPVF